MSIVKYNNNSVSDVTSGASLASGAMTHIKTIVSSNDDDVSFVHGSSDVVFDSTYPIYVFKFINIHPSEQEHLFFNLSVDSGSNYNVEKTTTLFQAAHNEADSVAASKTLNELGLPKEALVGAYVREGEALIGRGTSQLLPGDHVLLIARPEKIDSLREFFHTDSKKT